MKMGYVDIPEGQIHYKMDGSGEPLLLLHQTPIYEENRAMMPFLAKDCQVVAMDTVGYGNSFIPSREYAIEDFAQSVINFLDAMEIKKTSIFGHHTGAVIGVEVAAAYPERVDKLILSGCPYWSKEKWGEYLGLMRARRSEPWPTADGQFLLRSWEVFRNFSPDTGPDIWIKAVICSVTSRANSPYDAHFAIGEYDIIPRIPQIESPTLLISGSKDMFLDLLEVTQKAISRCRTTVIEGGGVLICLEEPKELAQAILNFLKNPGV